MRALSPFVFAAVLVAACSSDDGAPSSFGDAPPAPGSPPGTPQPPGSTPPPTGVPGDGDLGLDDSFDGAALDASWTVLNGDQVTIAVADGVLRMTPTVNCVWFNPDQGPGLIKLVTGNFKATTSVRARRASQPSQPPPPSYQFAGLIARDPASANAGAQENYVFTVMGDRGGYLTNETKTTVNDVSDVHGPDEGRTNADAQLRICRVGQEFRVYNRPPEGGIWKLERNYDRSAAPLPETLQVGPIAYTYTDTPDMVGEFDYVTFRAVSGAADCITD